MIASLLSTGESLLTYAWYVAAFMIGLPLAIIWLVVVVILGMPGPFWLLVPLMVVALRYAQHGRWALQRASALLLACLSALTLTLGGWGAVLMALMGNINGTHLPIVYAFDEWNRAVYSLGALLIPPDSDVAATSYESPI